MTEFLVAKPLFSALLVVVTTLLSKWAWDRWFSQASRVTKKECSDMRTICEKRLKEGDECFETFSKTLMVLLLAQLKVCEHLKIDCSDIRKAMIQKGLMD